MFNFLHKVYLLGWSVLIIGGVLWLYPRSGIPERLAVAAELWSMHDETPTRSLEQISGVPIQIVDGGSFTMRASNNQLYTIGLAGVNAPPVRSTQAKTDPGEQSRALLSDLILSNEVDVALSWVDPQFRGIGLVRAGAINVNAEMVESGLVRLNREYLRGLPLREKYALVAAERRVRLEDPPGN
jgi:endonuclease YncB( thermonuclease family)